jgi:ApbE superfamily uncharacterized protein (UPF0280 family)
MATTPSRPIDGDRPGFVLRDDDLVATLTVEASPGAIEAARRAAAAAIGGLARRLSAEDAILRTPARVDGTALVDPVSRRMWRAVRPFAAAAPIAPMVARDGAVAEELLAAVTAAATLDRAIVRVGGATALHLTAGFGFRTVLASIDDGGAVVEARAADMVRGIAAAAGPDDRPTFGIAGEVVVAAQTAAKAAAAAAVIADAVDLPGHPSITRVPANLLDPSSAFADRPVVRAVGRLSPDEVTAALAAGQAAAERLVASGAVGGCAVVLRGAMVTAGRVEPTGARAEAAARPSRARP